MKQQIQDYSYYHTKLTEHLESSFPEKLGDSKFIEQRSRWAANAYDGALKSGNNKNKCDEIADFILYEGLHFSKFDTLFEVLTYEFRDVFDELDFRDFALKILPPSNEIFEKYDLKDDFAYTTDFDLLYIELTRFIALWIEQNGIR